jgi:hypothetical protein
MFVKPAVLVFLLACHTSSPTVASGSGSGETGGATRSETQNPATAPQIAAPDATVTGPTDPGAGAPPTTTTGAPTTTAGTPSKPAPTTTTHTPVTPPSKPAPAPAEPAGAAPGMSEKCGDGDRCAAGLTCVSYYGIAGARGPQFKSCEMRCESDKACPAGKHCAMVADGPGRVCR